MSSVNIIIAGAQREGNSILSELEAKEILKEYGIPVVGGDLATSEDEAVQLAAGFGYPVVLKVVSPQITHKSDSGGVKLNLKDAGEVLRAYREIMAKALENCPGAEIKGVVVQPMARPGRELVIGAVQDSQFGPVVMFGLGGIFVEVLKDVSFRLAPVDHSEALDMLREIKGYRLLEGLRGELPCDLEAILNIIIRLSNLIYDYRDEVSEIDINPLFAYHDGAIAIDARIILKS